MKTEIFATFGPVCREKHILRQMVDAGMTGMRLNLSHTALAESGQYIENYRSAAAQAGVVPQILIDMQGPELRVGKLAKPMELVVSEKAIIGGEGIPVPLELMEAVEIGDEILLDDGKILVKIVGEDTSLFPEQRCVVGQVIRGGILQSHKSIKIIGKNVKMPPLTLHDIENIKLASTYGVTALMQPFVLSGEELRYVRNILKEHGAKQIQIYAKIENRLGVEHIEEILSEADVIIIARGDLGNDMPLWELPRVQKQIETACKKAGKPYIVVTQMLASMENNPVPTRAEVSDIFHAVYHGAWGVMITGETAVGKYPVEAVRYLVNTAEAAEKYRDEIVKTNI